MKCSKAALALAASLLSLPALAEDEQGFENFLLASPSIISPSQSYQVKGGRFEAGAGVTRGSFEGKSSDLNVDIAGTNLLAGYAQALNGQLVISADVDYYTLKSDNDGKASESTETLVRPAAAFSITPLFTLGASANIASGKETDETSESYSYTTVTIGGTVHQDLWEGTVALTTKNKDDDKPEADAPQALRIQGRYKVMPVLALGLGFEQLDYAGLDSELETESSYKVILESAFNEQSKVEVAFVSTQNSIGDKGADSTLIFLGGSYKVVSNIELGAQARLMSRDADTYKSSLNQFLVTFTSYH